MRARATGNRVSHSTFSRFVIGVAILLNPTIWAFDGQTVWTTTERAPVIENASAHAEHPRAVSDGQGGVVVAWQHEFTGGIRVQRLDHTGTQQWISTGLVLSITGYAPQIAVHPAGGVVVAWYETEPTKTGIYVQRVDAGGNPAWTPGGVQIATVAARPALCATSTAGTFVAWFDLSTDARIGNINDAGQPTAPGVNGVSLGANGAAAFDINLVRAGLGTVMAVWQDDSLDGRILAQKVGPGFPWGGTPRVVAATLHRHHRLPSAATDGAGGAVVAWQSLPRYGATGGVQIRTQRIDGGGATQWTSGGIVLVDSDVVGGDPVQWSTNRSPAIASDLEAGAFVAWDDWRHSSAGSADDDVYVQRIDLWGDTVWDDNGINLAMQPSGIETDPHLVTDGAGGVLVSFGELTDAFFDNWEVMSARIDRLGNFHWISPAYYDWDIEQFDQLDGQLVFDNSGPLPRGVIYVWLDTVEDDIYAQKYEVSRPFGDLCNADTPVLEPGLYEINLAGSDAQTVASCGGVDADLWFRFIAPGNGTLVVSTCGTHDFPDTDEGVDTVLSLHSACPEDGANYELACNDDWFADQCTGSDGGAPRDSYVETPLSNGQQVLIRVSRYSSSFNGQVMLTLEFQPAPPPNDACADAISIGPGTYWGTTFGASTDATTSCAGSESDVWYRYTAPIWAPHLFSTCGTHDFPGIDAGPDTVLSIHSACPEPTDIHEIACNDDASGACGTVDQGAPRDSRLVYLPAAGETVLIRVARFSSTPDGEFLLHVAPPAGRVPRDDWTDGPPLLVSKLSAGELWLTWRGSCGPWDNDYAVYMGPLGEWGLHAPIACSTGGATDFIHAQPGESVYYLVVPHNGVSEGAYGTQRYGQTIVERPQSPATCYPQAVETCP